MTCCTDVQNIIYDYITEFKMREYLYPDDEELRVATNLPYEAAVHELLNRKILTYLDMCLEFPDSLEKLKACLAYDFEQVHFEVSYGDDRSVHGVPWINRNQIVQELVLGDLGYMYRPDFQVKYYLLVEDIANKPWCTDDCEDSSLHLWITEEHWYKCGKLSKYWKHDCFCENSQGDCTEIDFLAF